MGHCKEQLIGECLEVRMHCDVEALWSLGLVALHACMPYRTATYNEGTVQGNSSRDFED